MRTLKQPGPVSQPRRVVRKGALGGRLHVTLTDGDLLEGLRDALAGAGVDRAGVKLLGGTLDGFWYMTGMVDPTGARVATYGAPTVLEGPVTLVSGDAILGAGPEGEPLVHCHAVLVDGDGKIHGGHVVPGKAPVVSVTAIATVTEDAGFEVGRDDETNYSIFQATGFQVTGFRATGAAS